MPITLAEYEQPFAGRVAADHAQAHRENAAALMTTARLAKDADDFVMLADCISPIELTEDQRRRLYEAFQLPPEQTPSDRMMAFWQPFQAIVARRDDETETILLTALQIALERYGAGGEIFSANTLLPLLPEHRKALAGRVMQKMRNHIEPVGSEPSANPSHRGSRIRTYRLRAD